MGVKKDPQESHMTEFNNSISLVVPAFNEEEILKETIEIFERDLSSICKEYEIIIVDDGSTDRTGEIANQMAECHKSVKAIHHSTNKGAGTALLTGFRAARNELVLTNFADRPFDLRDLKDILPLFKETDFVVVTRSDRSANPPFRRLTSMINYLLIRLLFNVRVKDFQFVQIYKRSILNNIKIKSIGSFVPPEIIIKALNKEYRMKEFETTFHRRSGGVAKYGHPRRLLNSIREIFSFWWAWVIKGHHSNKIRGWPL